MEPPSSPLQAEQKISQSQNHAGYNEAAARIDPALSYLNTLDDMERVKTIGELAEFNKALSDFRNRQLGSYETSNPPPNTEDLLKSWEKEFKHTWSRPETEQLAQRQLLSGLAGTEIELRKSYEIGQIHSARNAWNMQLGQARLEGDTETAREWELLGKGIFYSDSEEQRQQTLSSRFDFLKQYNNYLSENPSKALDYVKQHEQNHDLLPPTVSTYLSGKARSTGARQQEEFAKSLIENELNGTLLGEDALNVAVQRGFIKEEQALGYLERYSEDRPLRTEDSIKLPLLNKTTQLIDSYIPANDPRGERRRSILSIIASGDYDPVEKKKLVHQLEEQINNPGLAALRQKAGEFLQQKYEQNGLGAYSAAMPGEGTEETVVNEKETWLNSHKKMRSAQQAVNDYLEANSNKLPTHSEWEEILPKLVYKATREKRRIDFSKIPTINGYPIGIKKSGISADNLTKKSMPDTENQEMTILVDRQWDKTLEAYFAHNTRLKPSDHEKQIETLFRKWLVHRKTSTTPVLDNETESQT